MQIVCIGDCGIDHYITADKRRVGGITTNFSLHARRYFKADAELRVVAPLGDDRDAALVRQRFEGSGISCDFITMPGRTPVQHIEVDKSGERHFVKYDEGVLKDFRIDRVIAPAIAEADLIVAPVFDQNVQMFRSVLGIETDGVVAVDFADFAEYAHLAMFEAFISGIDIAFFGLSADDDQIIRALRSAAAGDETLIVVTMGAAGSVAFKGTSEYRCEALRVPKVVDTTGAGDAFAAGFLSEYMATADASPALSKGSEAAAECIQQFGGS